MIGFKAEQTIIYTFTFYDYILGNELMKNGRMK